MIIGMGMSSEKAVHHTKLGALTPNEVSCTVKVTGAVVFSVFSPRTDTLTLFAPLDSHSRTSMPVGVPLGISSCLTTVKSAYLAFFTMTVQSPVSPVGL
ncbi:hypothetical protein [Bacteroides heparinolyticus]|uniref:hypothetical protein n=1 Tax=Prevotella heparinolytica TaxID=28113 RepID=UPI0035A09226